MCTEKRSYRPAIAPLRVPILDGEKRVQYYRISEIRLADMRTKLFDYALAMEHKREAEATNKVLDRAIEKFGEWYDAGFARPVTKEHVTKILETLRQEQASNEREKAGQLFREMQRIIEETKENRL